MKDPAPGNPNIRVPRADAGPGHHGHRLTETAHPRIAAWPACRRSESRRAIACSSAVAVLGRPGLRDRGWWTLGTVPFTALPAAWPLAAAVSLAAREPSIPRDQLPPAWTHQGEILLEQGHFAQAEAVFRQAITADPNTADAWIGLARSSFLKQNFAAAADYAHRNYELTATFNRDNLADTAEATMGWARYRAETGESAAAVKQVQAAMPEIRKMYGDGSMRARYLQAAAQVYNRAGLFQPAEQNAREALDAFHHSHLPEVHPMAAAAQEDLGEALAGLKRYREAIPALEKALEIDRKLGTAYVTTAERVQVALNQARNHL